MNIIYEANSKKLVSYLKKDKLDLRPIYLKNVCQSGIFSIETSRGDHLITSIGDW